MPLPIRRAAIAAALSTALMLTNYNFAAAEDLPSGDLPSGDLASIRALYEHLHQNPELSFQETKSAQRMGDELDALGFDVTRNVGGNGLFGIYSNGDGPTLMIRADMDGLPVKENTGKPYASKAMAEISPGNKVHVMHACGHDVHMSVWVGAARRLIARKGEWSGTLVMIAQPAEERGAGARDMLADGLFERVPLPDYNLALHVDAGSPAGTVATAPGFIFASVDSVDITVYGKGGHGAYPHLTRDPIVIASKIVLALQTLVSREISPLDAGVVTVGAFNGGAKHNVIPDDVHLQLTVRSYDDAVRDTLLNGIKRIARGEALASGVPEDKLPLVEIKDEYTPSTYNEPAMTARVRKAFLAEFGPERAVMGQPVMGGEDFGRYGRTSHKIPSVMFRLGAVDPKTYKMAQQKGETLPSLHSALFAPEPDLALETGMTAMVAATLELLGTDDKAGAAAVVAQ